MFSRIDRWVNAQAQMRGASLNPPVARWSIFQIAIGLSVSSFALSFSFIAICLSLWDKAMWLAIVALVFGILAFVFTVFVFAYSIHLARMWLAGGSMDKTAEKDDITKLDIHINNKLDVLITEVKGIRNDLKEVCKYDKPKSDKPDEPKP